MTSIPPGPLWLPRLAGSTPMDNFRESVNRRYQQNLQTSKHLHRWSVDEPQKFWPHLYEFLKLVPKIPPGLQSYDPSISMSRNPTFFPDMKSFNYAENAMFANLDSQAIALIGLRDDTDAEEHMTWQQFRDKVRLTASALRRCGIKQGDRVAALVATSIWAMILFHSSASIGAIFTSISPDLGLEGCISRLRQIKPSIMFADSDTIYKGKATSTSSKVDRILKQLLPRPQIYIIPLVSTDFHSSTIDHFLGKADPASPLTFTRVPFNYPLMICYSSGTTGAPKCIVHQHGIIIQLKKVAIVHNSTTVKDVILQYSSTSWIVFYIMCGYFASGATTIVYNGSPLFPDAKQLFRIIQQHRVTYFGTSPRFLLEIEMMKFVPREEMDLSSLRIVYSTGATLSAEQYRWFYRAFPGHVQLCNTAGGTDTATSLIAADPCSPIMAGEMQMFGLGMDVDIADPQTGESILHTGEAGEMVIRKPFPSMPCFFWGDADGSVYRSSYFDKFPNVWAQHDWLQCNIETGGLIMHGRSDGVLNPSGIRFGSGEIYSIVEAAPFTEHISNTLCVGRRRLYDQDEDVFLFVVMKMGHELTVDLVHSITKAIRDGLSPRHVPHFILRVREIPTTINGKKVEAAVKQIISGKNVRPSNTVINPESLEQFKQFRPLEREPRRAKM